MKTFKFLKKAKKNPGIKQLQYDGLKKWNVAESPMPANIIWENFGQKVAFDTLKDYMAYML